MMNICIGYYKDYYEKNILYSCKVDFYKYPHALVVGASGSGKSFAVEYYIKQLLKYTSDITVLDFKSEFTQIDKVKTVYNTDVINAFESYYKRYKSDKKAKFLIIDEYPALINYLELLDKKKATEIKQKVAEMLMLARSFHSAIWIIAQRPDAALFSSGARDNFMTKVALGNLSAEANKMIFNDNRVDYKEERNAQGEGYVQLHDSAVYPLKIDVRG